MSSNAPVSRNADRLAHPVRGAHQELPVGTPLLLLLPLVGQGVLLACNQRGHDDPFRDRRAVDAGRRGDRDVAVRHDRVRRVVVHAGGEEMDQFQAVEAPRSGRSS